MPIEQPPRKPIPSPDPERTQSARPVAQEYIDDQMGILKKLRGPLN
jgi:hypothetical protein